MRALKSLVVAALGISGLALALTPLGARALGPGHSANGLKAGAVLMAAPELRDPNFSKTVVLLINYSPEGAMGVVLNRSTEATLDKVLPDVKEVQGKPLPVYYGGPVSRNQIFLLLSATTPPKGAITVFGNIQFIGNRDAMIEAFRNPDPHTFRKVRVYAGYAGWSPRQLDQEVGRGDWVVLKADPHMVFSDDPDKVWPELLKRRERIEVRGPVVHPAGAGFVARDAGARPRPSS